MNLDQCCAQMRLRGYKFVGQRDRWENRDMHWSRWPVLFPNEASQAACLWAVDREWFEARFREKRIDELFAFIDLEQQRMNILATPYHADGFDPKERKK